MALQVKTYSGYKADERPTAFEIDGRSYEVTELVDRWYGPDYEYFRVRADDGNTYILRHDKTDSSWSLTAYRRESGS
jgi:hypothetical protein